MTCTWTKLSWLPSTWTSTRCASGPSSTPATPTGTARCPLPSGASASGERVSILGGLCGVYALYVHRHSSRAACADMFPLGTRIETSRRSAALRCSHLCAVCWSVTICHPTRPPAPPVGEGSPRGGKNIPAARRQPVSPTALGDGACLPASQAETRSQSQANTDLEEKTWGSILKSADH